MLLSHYFETLLFYEARYNIDPMLLFCCDVQRAVPAENGNLDISILCIRIYLNISL